MDGVQNLLKDVVLVHYESIYTKQRQMSSSRARSGNSHVANRPYKHFVSAWIGITLVRLAQFWQHFDWQSTSGNHVQGDGRGHPA